MGEAAFPVERRFGSGFESSKQKVLNTEKKTKDDCVRRDVTDTDGTRPNDPAALSLSLSLSFFLRRSQSLYLFVSACLRLRRLPRHAMRRGKRSAARRPISRHQRPPPSHAASQKGKKKPVQLGKRRRQTRNSVKTQQTYGQLYFTGTINPVKSGNRIRSSNKFEIEKTRS